MPNACATFSFCVEGTKNYSKENASVYACKVLSTLISQGEMKFADIRKLLRIRHDGNWYVSFLEYIVKGIEYLKAEWDEEIPPITCLVFLGTGKASEWTCRYLTGNPETQPTPQQLKKVKEDVAEYDKWDKVLEYFAKGKI